MQTVGRLCRTHLRPVFLVPTYVAARGAPPPPQTALKTFYDIAGTASCILVLNYLAAPFMLLTWRDSIVGWTRLAWYGHFMVFGALAFFYAGGTKSLKRCQAARMRKAGVKPQAAANGAKNGEAKVNGNGSTTVSGATTPRVQYMPPVDDVAKEVEATKLMHKFSD